MLRAVGFDLKRLEVRSDPVPVVEQVMTTDAGEAIFAVSRTGTLVYVSGGVRSGHGPQRSLVRVARQGMEEPIKAPPRAYVYPRLSPDGARVALNIAIRTKTSGFGTSRGRHSRVSPSIPPRTATRSGHLTAGASSSHRSGVGRRICTGRLPMAPVASNV